MRFVKFLSKLLFVSAIIFFNVSQTNLKDYNGKIVSLFDITNVAFADMEICTNNQGYCKNIPGSNDGYCFEDGVKICCVWSSATNKDCYNVGY